MKRRRHLQLVGTWLLAAAAPAMSQQVVEHFSGSGPGRTDSFRVAGPWLLNWQVTSEFPAVAYMEILLYDVQTGRFLGLAAQHDGAGSGQQVIREGGQFRIVVAGRSIDWSIEIDEASGDLAAVLRAHPDATRLDFVTPESGLTRDMVEHISTWQARDEMTLVLRMDDGSRVSVGFYGKAACPGLTCTGNIYFVTSGVRGEVFNAILLEDGSRCFLDGSTRLD